MLPHLDLQIDVANCLEEGLGQGRGITPVALAQGLRQTESILKAIWDLRRLGQVPFLELPYQEAALEDILGMVDRRHGADRDIVVCGFGGSALGTAALVVGTQKATRNLGDPQHPRLHILDTLDPATLDAVWDLIDPARTLFLFNSQSGKTIEVLAQFELFSSRLKAILGSDRLRDQIIVITRRGDSPLWSRAQEDRIPVVTVPQGVGGRFSVLSVAHLLPAALCQVDILSLLQGAKRMDDRVGPEGVGDNPAACMAMVLYLWASRHRHRSVVIWPYVDRLSGFGMWMRQLLSESLGKRVSLKGEEVRAGLTPILASGVATQHTELQLYLEGPPDKIFCFLTSRPFQNEPLSGSFPILAGRSMGELLDVSYQATRQALVDQGIPSLNIDLPEVSEYCLGQLLYLSEVAVAVLGGLMEVNPYDQPGVEAVKRAVLKSLTR